TGHSPVETLTPTCSSAPGRAVEAHAETLADFADLHAFRKADSGLPRDLFGRNLQDLRRLRPCPGCRNWFPAHGAWRVVEKATAARDVPVGEPWIFPGIARWPRPSPTKLQEPDAFYPPDLRVWRVAALEHPTP